VDGEYGSYPRDGGNGSIIISHRGFWVRVAARIPLALLLKGEKPSRAERGPTFALAEALKEGDVILTGDKVLGLPRVIVTEDDVELFLTGGCDGHRIRVPLHLPIALLTPEGAAILGEEWLSHHQR